MLIGRLTQHLRAALVLAVPVKLKPLALLIVSSQAISLAL
jgi:hypothetical protein